MTEISTQNQLIRLLYTETSIEEQVALCNELDSDSTLNGTFQSLIQAHQLLPNIKMAPSASCIDAILSYSRESAMQTQH